MHPGIEFLHFGRHLQDGLGSLLLDFMGLGQLRRCLLHHDLGISLAARAAGDPDGTTILATHLEEDLGRRATVADWLEQMQPKLTPQPGPIEDDLEGRLGSLWRLADLGLVRPLIR